MRLGRGGWWPSATAPATMEPTGEARWRIPKFWLVLAFQTVWDGGDDTDEGEGGRDGRKLHFEGLNGLICGSSPVVVCSTDVWDVSAH